jgi:hypothetical protein
MALKAYKHLTDGEVKIVNEGSAEETSLLADTVTGSSYLQLTSTGHSQEVAAAQGTALWVDVTSDLGSGGSSAQVFAVSDLTIPAGTDWSTTGHVLGTVDLDPGASTLFTLYLELSAPLTDGDVIYIGEWPTPGNASGSNDYSVRIGSADTPKVVSQMFGWRNLPNLGLNPGVNASETRTTITAPGGTQQVGLFNDGASTHDITVVHARAVFLIL